MKKFSEEFSKSIKKIPFLKGLELNSFVFSVVHPRDPGRLPKNILIVKYQKNRKKVVEILIQSPKDEILKDVKMSTLASVKIRNKNFYTDYDPEIDFFPSDIFPDLYTTLGDDEVITLATDEKNKVRLFESTGSQKPKYRILEFVGETPDEICGFKKCFVAFDRELYKAHLSINFLNTEKKTEISVQIFEDEENFIEELTKDVITEQKKIGGSLSEGKIAGKPFIFLKPSSNRLLIVKCMMGDDTLLRGFSKKLEEEINTKDDENERHNGF